MEPAREIIEITEPPPLTLEKSQPRPWTRYWARQLDVLFSVPLLAICTFLSTGQGGALAAFNFFLLAILLPITLEAWLLSSLGTTPGKWFFGIQVRHHDGSLPSFYTSMRRSLSLWLRGLGMGVPGLSTLAQLNSLRRLKTDGTTSWDSETGIRVHHEALPWKRLIILATCLASLSSLAAIAWL